MPRKKIVKSRKIVESHDDAVLCVAWFMEYLFENIDNYLYAFPRREMQILNYRVWGAKKWEIKFRKEHSISDSQREYMDLQAVVGEKLAMEDENGVLTSSYKKSRPSEWSLVCHRPDCDQLGLIGRPRELLKHLRVIHHEIHEFACLKCDLGFGSVNTLVGHQGLVHGSVPWCSDRHFSTRVRVPGTIPISGRLQRSSAVERIGSKLVGSKPFQDGEEGCVCKNMNELYPWLEMVQAQLAMPLVAKSVAQVVTKRKPCLVNDDVRLLKRPKIVD